MGLGTLEISIVIKCEECIQSDSYVLKRDDVEDALMLIDTINEKQPRVFTARQHYSDTVVITCKCGHSDIISV